MKIFLSEVEEFCPILPFRQASACRQSNEERRAGSNRRQQLDNGAVAARERQVEPSSWLALPVFESASISSGSRWPVRQSKAAGRNRWPRRRVLAHVGYLSQPQHWPPAEAAQWADLLAGVGLLGHRLTVSIDGVGLRRQLLKLNYAKDRVVRGKRDFVITHLVTDSGWHFGELRSASSRSSTINPFHLANELNTPVSGLDLSPMQYLSWLPFTLENFYLGLALPPPALPNMTNLPSRVELFIFGFGNSTAAFYLAELRKHFRRIHTAVSPEQHPDVPAYVVNHGLLNYTQYQGPAYASRPPSWWTWRPNTDPSHLARAAAAAAAASANVSSSVPKDFTPAAYLARVRALFSRPSLCVWRHSTICHFQLGRRQKFHPTLPLLPQPPLRRASVTLAEPMYCSTWASKAAHARRPAYPRLNDPFALRDQMRVINRRLELQERASGVNGSDTIIALYSSNLQARTLSFLVARRLFSCDERLNGYSRLCPCRRLA
uniref:alpha-1,6-mannosyl-glycoprotein 6-beta-N-acetylglucosaminyltransferase n=1 Tax=Macrostomum lignano TaxID=282301 RepID=A0A1I8FNF5_9PLAT